MDQVLDAASAPADREVFDAALAIFDERGQVPASRAPARFENVKNLRPS